MTNLEATQSGRITSLDFIRGVAVLGMLVANVPWHVGNSMSRVYDADLTSVIAWLSQYLIFDQRFMPLFAMLFGASILLLAGKAGKTPQFSAYYLRRMGLLLLLGVAHAYIVWPGDILITYAVCGPILLLFMVVSVRTLLIVGITLKLIGLAIGEWPFLYTETLEKLLFDWWVDYGEAPSTEAAAYAGSYSDLLAYNAWRNQFIQWTALPYFRMWNALGFMLIGMALFRLGILQGGREAGFYRKMVRISLVVGTPLLLYGVFARIGMNDSVGPYLGFTSDLPFRNITFRTGCAVLSFAVLGGLHLIYPRIAAFAAKWIEPVGRMALTNYVFHSVFFVILFHVFVPARYNTLDHDQMFLLVVLVWVIQLFGSRIWLARFKQGPLEALWRMMSGTKKQT